MALQGRTETALLQKVYSLRVKSQGIAVGARAGGTVDDHDTHTVARQPKASSRPTGPAPAIRTSVERVFMGVPFVKRNRSMFRRFQKWKRNRVGRRQIPRITKRNPILLLPATRERCALSPCRLWMPSLERTIPDTRKKPDSTIPLPLFIHAKTPRSKAGGHHADPHNAKDFIIADAKDADMAFGVAAPPAPTAPGSAPTATTTRRAAGALSKITRAQIAPSWEQDICRYYAPLGLQS